VNLRDLKYLIAVAEEEHFGRAAKISNVSQPALSMQIKKLEEELGVMLFERHAKSIMVTQAGKDILVRAREVIRAAESIYDAAEYYRDPKAGKISLGAFPTLAPYLFPKIIPDLYKKYPEVSFHLIEDKTADLILGLKNGHLDCAFLAEPAAEDEFDHISVFAEDFYLLVHESHRLVSRDGVTARDINMKKLLLLEEGHCLRGHVLDICGSLKNLEKTGFRATSLETLRQMVAANVGITLVPELAVLDMEGVRYIPFKGKKPKRKIALCWRKTSPKAEIFVEISNYIKEKSSHFKS
jgi:LysR family hydrogen peroxide-inducible transcriptional activator